MSALSRRTRAHPHKIMHHTCIWKCARLQRTISEISRYLQFVWRVCVRACVFVLVLKTQTLLLKTQTHACTRNMFVCGGVHVGADMCRVCTLAHALKCCTRPHWCVQRARCLICVQFACGFLSNCLQKLPAHIFQRAVYLRWPIEHAPNPPPLDLDCILTFDGAYPQSHSKNCRAKSEPESQVANTFAHGWFLLIFSGLLTLQLCWLCPQSTYL